jgi:hypothetical protein
METHTSPGGGAGGVHRVFCGVFSMRRRGGGYDAMATLSVSQW